MAKTLIRRITKSFFVGLTLLLVMAFLLSCLGGSIHPNHAWLMGFLVLAQPYLAVLLIISLIFWLITRPIIAILPLLAIIIGWSNLSHLFAVNKLSNKTAKEDSVIRVVTWNTQSFNGLSNLPEGKRKAGEQIAATLLELDADFICLQEFNHAYDRAEGNHIKFFTKQYPYYYFSKDYSRRNGQYVSGSILFSKHRILQTKRIPYPGAESLIWADVLVGSDTLRVYTTHLQSFLFKPEDYEGMEKIKTREEEAITASKPIIRKMKAAFLRRAEQAKTVRKALDQSPYPYIICGDFNDVPNSYTYRTIKGNSNDAFLEKGFGVGRTFISLAPTLRIDYILYPSVFQTVHHFTIDEDLSDHILQGADIRLKK